MNFAPYCFFDWETGSKNKYKCQPTQLAAIIVDGRKLIIHDTFNSEIQPILDDEKAIKLGLDIISDEALSITHKTREALSKAPELKVVWGSFVNFVNKYNPKKNKWDAPIMAGFNIHNYDCEIIRRCCEQFGPFDKEYTAQSLFHPFKTFDVMNDVYRWTESTDMKSISMDAVREWLGMSKDNAHDALQDVKDGVDIMIKFLKLYRHFSPKVKFIGACSK